MTVALGIVGLITLLAAGGYLSWCLVCTEVDYRINRMVSDALDGDQQ